MKVAVIGGGLIGLAVAWRCRQRGLDVTVHDPAPGGGAAAVAAGMLAPTGEARAGEEALGALMVESALRWPGFAADLTAASGLDLGYDRCGTLLVALTDDDLREIRRQVDYYQRLGQPIEPLTGRQVRDREPLLSPRVRGGAWAPGDHQVDPRRVLRALLVALRDTPIRRDPVIDLSTVDADVTVVAAGYGSAALAGLPVRPVKGQVLRLRAPARELRHVIRGYAQNRHVYLVPRADGELVVGATEEERGTDTSVTAGGVLDLLRPAVDLVPGLAEYPVVETRAGLRPGTPDNAPLLGVLRPGVVVATGHHRNGVLLAPVTADAVAELVATGRAPEVIGAFAPHRFGSR